MEPNSPKIFLNFKMITKTKYVYSRIFLFKIQLSVIPAKVPKGKGARNLKLKIYFMSKFSLQIKHQICLVCAAFKISHF